jgi:hypothetical protein
MAPRKRNPENVGLPKRWKREHGAYFYQVPKDQRERWDGKAKFLLGHTLKEASSTWSKRMPDDGRKIVTLNQLWDRYLIEVTPAKSPRTQLDEPGYAAALRPQLGHMHVEDVEPADAYEYFDRRKDQRKGPGGEPLSDRVAKTQARNEIKFWRHSLTKAVEWRVIKRNPFLDGNLRLDKERGQKARDRYIEDWEIVQCLTLKPFRKRGSVRMCQAYIRLKRVTGLRMTDMLQLRVTAAKDDGLHVHVSKTRNSTGRKQIFTWLDKDGNDTGRRAAWDACLEARPLDIAPWVFCTDEGKPYFDENNEMSSFESVWQRFMSRCLKETELEERFAERDIRAKVGSDAETIQQAQHILGNASVSNTRKHYRRKPDVIR